jgi:hypothetical protein
LDGVGLSASDGEPQQRRLKKMLGLSIDEGDVVGA